MRPSQQRPQKKPVVKKDQKVEPKVIKHFNNNRGNSNGNCSTFPEVKTKGNGDEFAQKKECLQFHPVFKLVDSLIGAQAIYGNMQSKNTNGNCNNRKVCPKYSNQMKQASTTSTGSRVSSCSCNQQPIVKRVAMNNAPMRTCTMKQDRVKTNICSINNNSNLRLTIDPVECKSKCNVKSTCSIVSNSYLEHLKNEIQNSKLKCTYLMHPKQTVPQEYVDKLKDEICVTRSKRLEEAKNIINELKSEILTYRMCVKHGNVPGSCSNVDDTNTTQLPPPIGTKNGCTIIETCPKIPVIQIKSPTCHAINATCEEGQKIPVETKNANSGQNIEAASNKVDSNEIQVIMASPSKKIKNPTFESPLATPTTTTSCVCEEFDQNGQKITKGEDQVHHKKKQAIGEYQSQSSSEDEMSKFQSF